MGLFCLSKKIVFHTIVFKKREDKTGPKLPKNRGKNRVKMGFEPLYSSLV